MTQEVIMKAVEEIKEYNEELDSIMQEDRDEINREARP